MSEKNQGKIIDYLEEYLPLKRELFFLLGSRQDAEIFHVVLFMLYFCAISATLVYLFFFNYLNQLLVCRQLFEPCLIQGVPSGAETANLNFLRDNAGIVMHPRTWGVPEILPLDKKLVRSGDTIDILRLDGLDPMIAWAMGAATGHTAVALWKDELVRTY